MFKTKWILNMSLYKENTVRVANRVKRWQWCAGKRNWTVENEWKKVLFLMSVRLTLKMTTKYGE